MLATVPSGAGRVVVVIDGLDEAEEDTMGVSWVRPPLFAREPSANVRVVLSAREMAERDWPSDVGLTGRCLEIPALEQLTAAEVAAVLRAAPDERVAAHATEPEFVAAVQAVSSGDPFYVRCLVDDLCAGRIATQADLATRPTSLDTYLDAWWRELSSAGHIEAVADVLGYLVVAHGPLTRDELVAIATDDAVTSYSIDDVLRRLRRYLLGSPDTGVALCHPRLVEHVRTYRVSPDEQAAASDRILAWIGRARREGWV